MALLRTAMAVVSAGALAVLPASMEGAGTADAGGVADAGGAPDASSVPPPPQGPALRRAVEALLERDAPSEDWRPLGTAAVPVLEEIARGPATPPQEREQAVRSLGTLEAPEAAVPLRAMAADARATPDERSRAAFALARQAGPASVADLAPLLQDRLDALRIGAARGLGQAGGEDAKKALEDRLELEEEPVVREAIQRTLTLMQP